jgi:hypothetical protein
MEGTCQAGLGLSDQWKVFFQFWWGWKIDEFFSEKTSKNLVQITLEKK